MSKACHDIWTYVHEHPSEVQFAIDVSDIETSEYLSDDGDDVSIDPLLDWMEKNKRVVIPRRPFNSTHASRLIDWIENHSGIYITRWVDVGTIRRAMTSSEDDFTDYIASLKMKDIPIALSRFRVVHMMVDNIDRIVRQSYLIHYRKLRKCYLNARSIDDVLPAIVKYIGHIRALGLSISSMIIYAIELGCDIDVVTPRQEAIVKRLMDLGQDGVLACQMRDIDITSIIDAIDDEHLHEVKCRLGTYDWVSLW